MALVLSSCGLGDKGVEDQLVYDIGQLQQTCELNTERLSKILETEITKDIACLENNIDQFVRYVRRENPAYVSRAELERFVNKFFPGDAEVVRDLLSLVYDLNSLLLKDPEDRISVTKIPVLFQLFYVVNQEGRSLYQKLNGLDGQIYWERRQGIFEDIEHLAIKVFAKMNSVGGEVYQININDFLLELIDILNLGEQDIDIDLIDSFLFAKRLIAGGDSRVITTADLLGVLPRASDIALTALDLLNVADKKFHDTSEEWFFYLDMIKSFKSFFHPWDEDAEILTHDNLLNVAERLLDNKYRMERMSESVKHLKDRLVGGDKNVWSFRDVTTLVLIVEDLLGMMYFNDVSFTALEDQMRSSKVITKITRPNLSQYHIYPQDKVKEYWTHFEYMALTYRYFSDEDGYNHYFTEFKRFKKGFNQVSLFRWLMTKVVNTYGHLPEGQHRKEVSVDDARIFMREVEGAARELGLWPLDIERFVSEAVNGSDLFQYHGNGNGTSDVEELTGYVSTIFSATKKADHVYKRLQAYCPMVGDNADAFEVPCYREHFLHIFFNELKLNVYFDRLTAYVHSNGMEEAQQYLINLELYSREIPDMRVPMTKTDLVRLVIAFSNTEAAFIRFDKDANGILTRTELDQAFLIFRNLLVTTGKLEGKSEEIIKSVFFYLVKEMRIPTTTQLVWFHVFGDKDKVTATRFNISAILSFFVTQ
jgi:hypothetical protein